MEQSHYHIVVLISGGGTNLQALIDASQSSNYKISAVISDRPEAFGLQRAKRVNIHSLTIDHKSFDSRDSFDQTLGDAIEEIGPDLVVLAGFMRILGADFVNRFEGRILNIHPSLLPKYPGINTHQRAIDAGDKEHGVSVHFVTAELDGGPIITQESVPVLKDDTAEALAARVLEKEHLVYPKVVSWFASGSLHMESGKVILDHEEVLPTGIIDHP